VATSTYGTPYVQGSDLVSAYPTASSNLATRVDEVSYKRNGLNAQTGTTYTLVAGDAGKTITLSNASAVAVTLPQDSVATLPTGAIVSFYNLGAGTVTISQGTGATLQGGSITLAQYEVTSVIKLSANTYGKYDGGAGGSNLVTTQTLTAVSTLSINNCFSATYDNYEILMSISSSVGSALRLRMRAAGTDATTTAYSYQELSGNSTTAGATRGTGLTSLYIGYADTTYCIIRATFYQPFLSAATMVEESQARNSAGSPIVYVYGSFHNVASSYDGFTVFPDSGTMTGTISVYGFRK